MALYLFELMLFLFSIIPGHLSRYRDNELKKTRQIEMEDVCNGDKKVELNIQSRSTSAIILNFSASSEFRCHLELEVDSNSYGIGVFFEEMNLEGRWPSQCEEGDHIQFGRDYFGVTTYSSSKFCGRVEAPVSKSQEQGFHKGLSFPQTKLSDKNRLYVESIDREMDIWMTVKKERHPKNLTLVVTPFKMSCSSVHDLSWKKCQKYSRKSVCVKKDLFCDGRVNCPVRETEATDENAVDCEALYVKTIEGQNIPKFALVIIVLALIGIMVFTLYILARKFGVCNKPRSLTEMQPSPSRATTSRTQDSPVGSRSPEQGRNSSPETIPMSGLPLNPPPYSEVVGYPQDELDNPPKYSDIMSHSKTIAGQ